LFGPAKPLVCCTKCGPTGLGTLLRILSLLSAGESLMSYCLGWGVQLSGLSVLIHEVWVLSYCLGHFAQLLYALNAAAVSRGYHKALFTPRRLCRSLVLVIRFDQIGREYVTNEAKEISQTPFWIGTTWVDQADRTWQ
jgi:hypothetical protein